MWTLCACLANVYDDIIKVDTVNIKFYKEAASEYAVLVSTRGQLNTKTHDIIVKDSVRLTTDDSTRLFADSLFWQNDSQKILTDCHVRILKKDGTVIEGRGLKTAPDLKRIEIIGDVKGESPIEFPKIK
jgi:LPS export ABC transporter protein LptC